MPDDESFPISLFIPTAQGDVHLNLRPISAKNYILSQESDYLRLSTILQNLHKENDLTNQVSKSYLTTYYTKLPSNLHPNPPTPSTPISRKIQNPSPSTPQETPPDSPSTPISKKRPCKTSENLSFRT
jgi:hypothetical protein